MDEPDSVSSLDIPAKTPVSAISRRERLQRHISGLISCDDPETEERLEMPNRKISEPSHVRDTRLFGLTQDRKLAMLTEKMDEIDNDFEKEERLKKQRFKEGWSRKMTLIRDAVVPRPVMAKLEGGGTVSKTAAAKDVPPLGKDKLEPWVGSDLKRRVPPPPPAEPSPPVVPPSRNDRPGVTGVDVQDTMGSAAAEKKIQSSPNECCRCGKPVPGQHFSAMGRVWHVQCMICANCGVHCPMFLEKDNEPYCQTCYGQKFVPKRVCNKCHQAIEGNAVGALGGEWHRECFQCNFCKKQICGEFVQHEGLAYCNAGCVSMRRGILCDKCQQPLTARVIRVFGRKLHPHCFKCEGCDTPFNSTQFYSIADLPYCYECACRRMQ